MLLLLYDTLVDATALLLLLLSIILHNSFSDGHTVVVTFTTLRRYN